MKHKLDPITTNGKFGGFLLQLWEPNDSKTDGCVNYAWKINMKFQTKSDAIAYAHSVNPHAD